MLNFSALNRCWRGLSQVQLGPTRGLFGRQPFEHLANALQPFDASVPEGKLGVSRYHADHPVPLRALDRRRLRRPASDPGPAPRHTSSWPWTNSIMRGASCGPAQSNSEVQIVAQRWLDRRREQPTLQTMQPLREWPRRSLAAPACRWAAASRSRRPCAPSLRSRASRGPSTGRSLQDRQNATAAAPQMRSGMRSWAGRSPARGRHA